MNYVKKMCILRQIKQGFSGDGKALSGLIKAEQYGKNLAVEVSIINFAPLVSGEYYCLLADSKGRTELLPLRGKNIFNILSDVEIDKGFCGVICYVKKDVVPIAYGINGNGVYDWKSLVNATVPPTFPQADKISAEGAIAKTDEKSSLIEEFFTEEKEEYNDERVAERNYYEEEENEQEQLYQTDENASTQSPTQTEGTEERANAAENVDAENVRPPFATHSDGYYRSVKEEIDGLFAAYPPDKTLQGAFACSEWARIQGSEENPKYLVGVLYEEGVAKYICYAIAAENRENPPEEIKDVCTFVPVSALRETEGFFVIFQSATGGECIKPERA